METRYFYCEDHGESCFIIAPVAASLDNRMLAFARKHAEPEWEMVHQGRRVRYVAPCTKCGNKVFKSNHEAHEKACMG